MRQLLIGDMHATSNELEDCWCLIYYIAQICKEQGIKDVCFLGDQFNSMSVLELEVLYFWKEALEYLKKQKLNIKVICGNHDYSSNQASNQHSLVMFKDLVKIIDEPYFEDGILYMPFMRDNKKFINICKEYACITNTVMGHAEFNSAQYDNGFYIKNGIEISEIEQSTLIMGHIHKPQFCGKLRYIGSPRWRYLSDANTDRNIWLYEFDDKGNVLCNASFSTNNVCKRIWAIEDNEESPLNIEDLKLFNEKDDVRIDLKGSESYIKSRKPLYSQYKVRTFVKNNKNFVIKESDGIKTAFIKYLNNFKPKNETNIEDLKDMSKELFNDMESKVKDDLEDNISRSTMAAFEEGLRGLV